MDWASQDLYVDVRPIMMARVFNVAEFQDEQIQKKAQNGWTRMLIFCLWAILSAWFFMEWKARLA